MVPGTGALRLARSAVFATAAVGLASAAHLAGGSGEVPALTALLAVPAVMLVVHLLAARRRGPASLFGVMALTQAGLHVTFMALSVGSACTPSTGMAMAMGSGHVGHLVAHCEPMAGHTGGLWPSIPMLIAHLLATLVVVLLLARGEAALWALAASLGLRFHRPEPVAMPVAVRLPVATAAIARRPQAVHLRTVRRRGPPVPAGAVR